VDGQRLSGADLVTVNAPYPLAPHLRAAGQLLWDALNVPAGRLLLSGEAF